MRAARTRATERCVEPDIATVRIPVWQLPDKAELEANGVGSIVIPVELHDRFSPGGEEDEDDENA